jgi:hypothetical protein
MVLNLRVSRDFMRAPANDLANLADDVVDGLTGNPAFPTPPVLPADLTTLNTTLRTAITAADAGGKQQTAAKNNAYAAVTSALRKDANYVEIQSDNDQATLLSSGFDIVSTNRTGAAGSTGHRGNLEPRDDATAHPDAVHPECQVVSVADRHGGERAVDGGGHLHAGAADRAAGLDAGHDLFCARAGDRRQHRLQRMERAGLLDGDLVCNPHACPFPIRLGEGVRKDG